MQPTRLFPFVFSSILLFFGALCVYSQDTPSADVKLVRGERPNLLATLGLSPEQIDQIKQINLERRPQLQLAVRQLRESNRALDMAVYADTLNELDVQARLRSYQAAQARLASLRFGTELAVRKVLTPDQLVKFRDLRSKFAEQRNAEQQRRRLLRPGRRVPKPIQQPFAPPN